MDNFPVPLSILDLAPVGTGFTPAQALRNSLDLIGAAERLGYHRYWVAEHHNMPGIASSSPAVLMAHLATATSTIRVGSGGVMLPNHAPLVIAEQFGMLEALHPGRIDLGLGRAPGTDRLTAIALRRSVDALTAEDFPEQFQELMGYFTGDFPEGHPFGAIAAVPAQGYRPAIWLLGSSDFGARMAGLLGLPFSYAHHFATGYTDQAVAAYRQSFRPSPDLDRPYLMLGTAVVCAESDERAQWLAGSGRLAMARLRAGRPGLYPTPEEAAAYNFTPFEREAVDQRAARQIVGTPPKVRARLQELADRTGADELMIVTLMHGHADRVRSYELVAEVCGLVPP